MTAQRKSLHVEFKANGPEGSFEATFSRFNVVDFDGDVTLPGAFTAGAKARIAQFAHNWNVYTIGKGSIQADTDRAWMAGAFNLKTTAGRDHYESVKDAGELQEWSYGYDAPGARPPTAAEMKQWPGVKRVLPKLIVHEVSPVMLGAGIGTRTESIKGAKAAPMSDEAKRDEIQAAIAAANGGDIYGGPYVVATFDGYVIVRDDDGYARIDYAMSPDGVVTIGTTTAVEQTWVPKGSRRRAGSKARAVIAAIRTKQATLDPGTLATIAQIDFLADELDELVDTLMDTLGIPDPDEIMEGEPEEALRSDVESALGRDIDAATFRDHANRAALSGDRFVKRAGALVALRRKEGRVLSTANWTFLASHADTLDTQSTALRKLLADNAIAPKSADARLRRMRAALGEATTTRGYPIT